MEVQEAAPGLGFFQWAGALAFALISGALAHIHVRINRAEDNTRNELDAIERRAEIQRGDMRRELQGSIGEARTEGREGLAAIRTDIVDELRFLRQRLDAMVTKEDLRDLLARHEPTKRP